MKDVKQLKEGKYTARCKQATTLAAVRTSLDCPASVQETLIGQP